MVASILIQLIGFFKLALFARIIIDYARMFAKNWRPNSFLLAIFEIVWSSELPDAVAIDEALTLAKEISTEESAGYIHGVLGRIASIKESIAL
jgi:hypothetical protein